MKFSTVLHEKARIVYIILIDIVCFLISMAALVPRVPGLLPGGAISVGVWILGLVLLSRLLFQVYQQMWRYANASVYLRIVLSDFVAGVAYLLIDRAFLKEHIPFGYAVAAIGVGTLLVLSSRFVYQVFRRMPVKASRKGERVDNNKINVGIVGAGEIGVLLAEELRLNPNARYLPYCYFDNSPRKIGTAIAGIPVYGPDEDVVGLVKSLPIQEIIIALPNMDVETQKQVFTLYSRTGCKVKVYDYPNERLNDPTAKRAIREVNIEDLLFRPTVKVAPEEVMGYYGGKTILVTGGGGSIGSELARQIARIGPKQLILLDVYENGVYDVQQEILRVHQGEFPLHVLICSICDREAIRRAFAAFKPDVVFHAAAHKHVPLMENNCKEAVENNVFGTLNVINAAEKYGCKRFVMISTDKAVNPTNIMGATKRMCEMIIQSRKDSATDFVAVRFGNVLGSNGSVVPLFKRQIAEGGPLTITDKRIIRYFMTIPEAVQLVLRTGRRAEKSEIFVLDMGEPVRILQLAENIISLSGFVPYRDIDIVEIGLRPGEKLYEELLINSDTTVKTEDARIYIDHDSGFARDEVQAVLENLRKTLQTTDRNADIRAAMMQAVPTYHLPEAVNKTALESKEFQAAEAHAMTHPAPSIPS